MSRENGTHSTKLPRHSYPVDYRLRIISRDTNTGNIVSVRCQLCVYSGRENEDEAGRKRKRQPISKVMDWNYPFRGDSICRPPDAKICVDPPSY